MAKAYICTENQNPKEIISEIVVTWDMKYIGRKIIEDRYYKLFGRNGYYIEDEQYDLSGITSNINPTVDEDGYITAVNGYKAKDKSYGHGRPQTDYLKFGKKDTTHFSEILDSVTVDPVEEQYELLQASFSKGEQLPGGYEFLNVTAKGISLRAPSGKSVSLSKTKIIRGLMISHSFVDVLFSEETLRSAPAYFDEKDIPVYLAIFSKVDYSEYRDSATLIKAAHARALLREAKEGYVSLIEAVTSGSIEKVRKLSKLSPIVMEADSSVVPPIIIATRNNDLSIAQVLMENGAFSREVYTDSENVSISPLLIAVQNRNYEMIKLICKHHGAELDHDPGSAYNYWIKGPHMKFKLEDVFNAIGKNQDLEALKIILPFASMGPFKTPFSPKTFSDLSVSDIAYIASIESAHINWSKETVQQVYNTDKALCFKMISQGCESDVVTYFIEISDLEFFKEAISHYNNIYPNSSHDAIYARGGEWYEALKNATSPQFNYMVLRIARDKYLSSLIQAEKFDDFKSAVSAMGISFPIGALDAFCNWDHSATAVTNEMQDFFDYVLDNSGYEEPADLLVRDLDTSFLFYTQALLRRAFTKTVEKYLKKYPLRITRDNKRFIERLTDLVEYRRDDTYVRLLDMKLSYDATLVFTEEERRYSDFTSHKQKTIFDIFRNIIFSYNRYECDLRSPEGTYSHKEKSTVLAPRWIDTLRSFIQLVPLDEIDCAVSQCRFKLHKEANTALDYAVADGIHSEELLSLLR